MKSLKLSKRTLRGDTIVEVLLSIAVISLALAISYSLANRSLRTGLSANARAEATAISQGQLELLKYIRYQTPPANYNTFKTGTFCINPATLARATANSAQCQFNGQYDTVIEYQASTNSYKLTTQWDTYNANATGQDELVIYYRLPD